MKPKYRIYIDESGDHSYEHCDEESRRFLCLTGCIIESEYYKDKFQPDLERIKQKYFSYDPDDPVLFVRQKIISKYGAFWVLRDDATRQAFNRDLLAFIAEHEFLVIAVVLDKKVHHDFYGTSAYHPYHFSVAAMMERYCGWLGTKNETGDSMAESRAGQDKYLKEAYRNLYDHGTFYHVPYFFQRALTSVEIKLKNKDANIAGLQLADLLAHPCKEEILIERGLIQDTRGSFTKEFRAEIEKKYNTSPFAPGKINGYGKIFLPKKQP